MISLTAHWFKTPRNKAFPRNYSSTDLEIEPIVIGMASKLSRSFLMFVAVLLTSSSSFALGPATGKPNPNTTTITPYEDPDPAWQRPKLTRNPPKTKTADPGPQMDAADKNAAAEEISGKVSLQAEDGCKSVAERARKACVGSDLSVQVSPLLNALSGAMATDQNKACKIARSIAALSTGVNMTLATSCTKFKNSCDKTCSKSASDNKNLATQERAKGMAANPTMYARYMQYAIHGNHNAVECKKYEGNVQQALIQSALSAVTFAQSQQCVTLTDPKNQPPPGTDPTCSTEQAFQDQNCPQWCLVPGRQNEEKCKTPQPETPQCSDPQYAEVPFCKPYEPGNPYDPTLPQDPGGGGGGVVDNGGGIGTGGGSRGDTSLGLGGAGVGDLPDLPPGQPPLKPVSNNDQGNSGAPPGGGGGGGGFSGFSGGGGGGGTGAGGEEDGKVGKEVFVPMSNAPAGGSEAMVSTEGGEGDVGPGGGFAQDNADGTPPFDLSKFLPKDLQERGPASDSVLAANGISDANGLSNWEKVTKKMNEKRKDLRP